MKLHRLLFSAALVCAGIAGGATVSALQPPRPRPAAVLPPAPAPKAAEADVPAPMPEKAAPGRALGRIKPLKQYDYGNFRAVVGSDGKTRYFARMGKHVDPGKQAAPIPPGPLNRGTPAAMQSISQMYGNDSLGDCVLASRGHKVGIRSAVDSGTAVVGTRAEVVADYHAACGAGDNGCDMSAVNQYEQRTGVQLGGARYKAEGSVAVDHTNKALVQTCIYVFGGLNVGLDLPGSWHTSADGSTWDVTNSGIVGGHEVQAYDYDAVGVKIATWGGTRTITWAAFTSSRWVNEVYTSLDPVWYGKDNLAPNGIDVTGLRTDLALVSNGQVPPLPDPVPTTSWNCVGGQCVEVQGAGGQYPTKAACAAAGCAPPPPPPPPPGPGAAFTGTISYNHVYVNGKETGIVVSVTGPQTGLESELKGAGVSPSIILDVMKLIADLKAKAGFATLMADLFQIITDLKSAPTGYLDRHPVGRPEWAVAV